MKLTTAQCAKLLSLLTYADRVEIVITVLKNELSVFVEGVVNAGGYDDFDWVIDTAAKKIDEHLSKPKP